MSVKQKKLIFNIVLILLVLGAGIIMHALKTETVLDVKSDITVEETGNIINTSTI